jgi:hypothetical protein
VDRTVSSIGIVWRTPHHDLDLSVRVKPGSSVPDPGELYWNTPPRRAVGAKMNALGKYLNDIRDGGTGSDYEWIELARQTSVTDLAANLEVWCDHYEGAGPVKFTAAIVDKGTIVAKADFTINGNGDKRAGGSDREHSASWVLLPVQQMLRDAAACTASN